jgi:oligoendopeptidase F
LPEDKWNLELMYENDEAWEKDFQKVRALLPELSNLKGSLGASAADILKVLELQDQIGILTEKLFGYARMRRDEDNTKGLYQELTDRIMGLMTEVSAATAFIRPELLAINPETLQQYLQEEKLSRYHHYLDDVTRLRSHVLSDKEEELLSMAGEVLETPETIYSMLSNADLTFPAVTDENGEEVVLTSGRFVKFLYSGNRQVREEAFTAMFSTLGQFKNTFNASLSAAVKKDIFLARARKYSGSLEHYLDVDNIPPRVYHNVVDTVNKNLAPLHRYVALKKKFLEVDDVHFYDLYVPLAKENEQKKYTFKEATELVLKALEPMGEEYVATVRQGIKTGWIDVYENKGKTSGGYSFGTFESPPYILLNFDGTLSDVFTLAHELGHSMHSYYTRQEQPFIYSHYSIFSAEVASTANESLLVHHLLKTTPPLERAAVINQYLEGIRGTLFRQTLFAEFELKIHTLAEGGEALTSDKLSSLWLELNQRYYGENFKTDPLLGMEWARIPHFYYQFYVYKYVTGFAAGTSFAKKILQEGEKARHKYIGFLKKGGSGYSLDILREAGVDMQTPAPLEDTISVFAELVEELSAALQT